MSLTSKNELSKTSRRAGDYVLRKLYLLLRDGTLAPGDRLVSERELAETFGVSRTVIRERLQHLESLGLIKTVPGQGTFIADDAQPRFMRKYFNLLFALQRISLTDIMSVRIALETEATRLACLNASDYDLVNIEQAARRIEAALSDPTLVERDYERAEYQFHDILVQASKNEFLSVIYDALKSLFRQSYADRYQVMRSNPTGSSLLIESHIRIASAIRARNPDEAVKEMHQHFDIAERLYGTELARKEVEPDFEADD